MKSLFYDSSWINDERLRQSFAHRLAANDGYTIQSFLNNPALASELLDDKLSKIRVPTLVVWVSKIRSSLFLEKNTLPEFPALAWSHSISADISLWPKKLRSFYPRSLPFLTRPLLRASSRAGGPPFVQSDSAHHENPRGARRLAYYWAGHQVILGLG